MATERIWLLNFDADEELALGEAYVPRTSVTSRFAALAERATGLVPMGDRVLNESVGATDARGLAFCLTPHALRALTSAGARVSEAPSFETLRTVNARTFCAKLIDPLPGARWITSVAQAEHAIANAREQSPWRFRSPWGFSGRGNLAVIAPQLNDAQRTWIERTLARDGVIELVPWVTRTADFGWHGFLSRDGACTFGEPTQQHCTPAGQWEKTERATHDALLSHERTQWRATMEKAVFSLKNAGYWGPFGVDAFRWRDEDGHEFFFAMCDLNARYSMGWAIGMGDRRPDLDHL